MTLNNADANAIKATMAQPKCKHYHSAGITNISSSLVYDRSGMHTLNVEIVFMHNSEGFEAVANAYNELVEDIHKLLLKSKDF